MERLPVLPSFVGLDLSLTGTGVAVKSGSTISAQTIKTTPKTCVDDLARLNHIIGEIVQRFPKNIGLICIEDFFTPHNAMQIGAAIKLVMLGTSVRLALYQKYPFVLVAPQVLKKYVTGKGNADKSLIVREVYKRWNYEAKNDNEADAIGLVHIAESVYLFVRDCPQDGLTMPQKEIVRTVANNPEKRYDL